MPRESPTFDLDKSVAVPCPPPRRSRRMAAVLLTGLAVLVVGLALLALGGWWRNSLRPENCYRRGRRALEAGDRQTAARESRRLLATPGYEPHGRLLSGQLLKRDGRLEEALEELAPAAHDEATAVDALTAAAECCYLLGRFREAINTSRTALARDAEALDARRWLAAAYYDLGAATAAARELEIISSKAPRDARPDRLLGLIDKDNERFTEAVEHYRESLRRDPHQTDRPAILVELAESLVKLNRFDEALDVLRDCDRTAPVLTLAAECELNLGRWEAALDGLRTALTADPHYLPAQLQLGTLFLQQGHLADAAGVLEKAERLAPHSSQAHFHLAQVYGRQGERDKAAEQLRLMRETQAVEREFTDLHEAAAQKPDDADVRYRIGVVARQLGKLELARMWFRAALAIQPNHAKAREALSDSTTKPIGP